MKKYKLVIVGGGFAGVKLALDLWQDKRFAITIVSDRSDFRNYPTLYLTATGGKRLISSIPLAELFADKSVDVVIDPAVLVDRTSKTIVTKSKRRIPYDGLVLAMGVVTNYFGIKGLDQYSHTIKSPEGAEALKSHLHEQMVNQKRPDLNYVVIGGGPTGIELASVSPGYLKWMIKHHGVSARNIHVDLVEAAPKILPRSPKDVSKRVARQLRKLGVKLYLNTTVQAQTADVLMVNGKPIRSHTVIWTAGVMNHPFFAEQGFQISPNRKVRVDQFLQTEPGIYVIGDNADTPYSGMAQTALYDAKFLAHNFQRIVDNKQPRPYHAKRPVYVFPAGPHWAAVQWGPLRLYGRIGYMLRSLADLVAYHDYEPWWKASKRWAALDDKEESCPYCS